MNAYIELKTGQSLLVPDITKIKEIGVSDGSIRECTDFSSFTPYSNHYIFIGERIATVRGGDILYVLFSND